MCLPAGRGARATARYLICTQSSLCRTRAQALHGAFLRLPRRELAAETQPPGVLLQDSAPRPQLCSVSLSRDRRRPLILPRSGTGCVPLSGTPPPACRTSVLGQALGRVPGPSYYPGPEAARSGLCGSLHSVQLAYCAACRGGLFLCFPLSVARGGTQRSGGHGGQAGRCVPLFPQPAALSVHSALVLELPSAWPLIFLKHLLCAGDFSPMRRSCRAAGFQGTAD